jgi:hypothetical protein
LTSAAAIIGLATSSIAGAETTSPPAPAPQAQSSWAALSMMSPVGATALGGAAVAAQPVPPPPPPGYYQDRLPPPPIPVLLVWLATLLVIIYIATRHDHHPETVPNSPA